MKIKFLELKLKQFKNHRDLVVNFADITRISGANGIGKSSIGDAITWLLFGTNTFGTTLDPAPIGYEYEQVEVGLLLQVDDKTILLEKEQPAGKAVKYRINEVPKKATDYKLFVEQLFDKLLFLSLFTPTFLSSQHRDEQRSLMLRNVLPPSNKEVFAKLPASQADKLSELITKKTLDDLEKQHKENKKKQDKALIAAKSRTKTLTEQLDGMEDISVDRDSLVQELREIDRELESLQEKQAEARANNARIEKLKVQLQVTRDGAEKIRSEHKQLKSTPIEQACYACGQKLSDEAAALAEQTRQKELDEKANKYKTLSAQYNRMSSDLSSLKVIDVVDARELMERRHSIANQLQQIEAKRTIVEMIEDAKVNEKQIHESYTESVFILDAIKAFNAKEAEMMTEKVSSLFENITLQLFQVNKGDGEHKPWFEVEFNGKPYHKLSTAERIKAGLEIISVLSQQSGVGAPVFVDNAESIITYKAPAGQLIECRVADKPLTIEEV